MYAIHSGKYYSLQIMHIKRQKTDIYKFFDKFHVVLWLYLYYMDFTTQLNFLTRLFKNFRQHVYFDLSEAV